MNRSQKNTSQKLDAYTDTRSIARYTRTRDGQNDDFLRRFLDS